MATETATPLSSDAQDQRGSTGTVRAAVSSFVGAILGVAPHVLHHVGFIAGSALVTGTGGNLAFYALGLLLSFPMLRRLYRRFGTWAAPVMAVVLFTALFVASNLLAGAAVSRNDQKAPTNPPATQQSDDHAAHHQ